MNYETMLYVIWIFKLFSDLLFNEKFLVRAKIVGHCIIGRRDGCCGEHVSSLLKFTIFCYFKDFITRLGTDLNCTKNKLSLAFSFIR